MLRNYINKYKTLTTIIFASIIGIVAFSLYYKTLEFDLVYCDDNIFVHQYEEFNSNINNVPACFKQTFGTSYYRPILGMSFVFDYYFGNNTKDPLSSYYYQLTNNVLHASGSMLVFIFFVFLGYDKIKSLLFGLIFAVHPILTPSAAWISGRNDSMITIFILMSFIFLIKYLDVKSVYRYIYLVFQLCFYATALFTKEVAAMTPFVFIIYLYFYRNEKFFNKNNIILILSWFVIGLMWYFKRHSVLGHIKNPDDISISAFITNLPSVPDMIGKVFLPIHNLPLPSLDMFSIITGILSIVIIIYLVFSIKGTRKRYSMVGFAWFIIFLAPTLMIRILNVGDFFDYAEHRAYLPMVGIFLLIMELLRAKKVDFNKPLPLAIGIIIILSFGLKSYYYQDIFNGRKNFWQHKVDLEPNVARGYMDLSLAYIESGELDKAEKLNHDGIKLNKNNASFYLNLSTIYLKKQKFTKAEKNARIAIKLDSTNKNSLFSLANILYSQKKFKQAIPPFIEAIKRSGKNPNFYWVLKLAVSYHNISEPKEAIKYYNYVLKIKPNDYDILINYGLAHNNSFQYEKAINIFKKAIQINPQNPTAYNQLIRQYLITLKYKEAKELYSLTLKNNIIIDSNFIPKLKSLQ